jgi:hypothetical protein
MTDKTEMLKSVNEQTASAPDNKNGTWVAPDSLLPYGERLVAGGSSAAYAGARSTLKVFNETLTTLRALDGLVRQPHANSRQEVTADGSTRWTVAADKLEDFTSSMQTALNRAGKVLDTNRKTIADSLAAVDTEISGRMKDTERNTPARAAESAEVRAHLRSLKTPADRMSYINTAIKDGRRIEVAACLGSPAVTSGITPAQQADLRALGETAFFPELNGRRDALAKTLGHVDRAAESFVSQWQKYLPKANANAESLAGRLEELRVGKK